ncbi:MAG: exosome protein [Thermoprotei archaeon]|nr:MAG: exosome protein [Thermoprotei archaeon]RLF17087.1 MAG: exosome protein [Thermoprotei archaeon]
MSSAYIEAFSHATEDLNKVSKAMLNLLPPELRGKVEVSYEAVKGHYDNQIVILRTELKGEDAECFIKYIASSMSEVDKAILRATLDLRMEESRSLYLRLDKGAAYAGKFKLVDRGEAIKVKLTLTLPRGRSLRSYLSEVGLA